MNRFPTLFISHGSPEEALEESRWSRALRSFGERLRPSAVVVMSAHWEKRAPVRVTSWDRATLLHDYSGFPPVLSRLGYPAPGAPEISERVVALLKDAEIGAATDSSRPLDHGVWVPLRFLYPAADVATIEISLPIPRAPEDVTRIGRALAPLREKGILLVGTGGLVHNLLRVRFREKKAPADGWARMFEDWVIERLEAKELETLQAYRSQAPSAPLAAPTPEHFDPLFFPLGATGERDRLETVYEGFEYGNLSMRTLAFVDESAQV